MIGDALHSGGLSGLGNGHSRDLSVDPLSGIPGRRRPQPREAAPSERSSAAVLYGDVRRYPEDKGFTLSPPYYPGEVAAWGGDPFQHFTVPHHGPHPGGSRAGHLAISGHGVPPPATILQHGAQTGELAYRERLTGPVQFLNKLLDTWCLDQGAALAVLGLEESQQQYLFDLLNGISPLEGRDIKDRIAHLFKIRKMLSGLFQDQTVENEWLREPHRMLDDREPMTLMLEGSMENLLLVKEYVETAAGL